VALNPSLFANSRPILLAIPILAALVAIWAMAKMTHAVIRRRTNQPLLSSDKRLTMLFFCILLVGAACIVSRPLLQSLYWSFEERTWSTVTGTIGGGDGFSYTVNGTLHNNDVFSRYGNMTYKLPAARSRLWNVHPERVPGFALPVYYDPNNPQMSVLDKRRLTIEDYIVLAFSFVLWYVAIMAILLTI
jgi:hypothetical protein